MRHRRIVIGLALMTAMAAGGFGVRAAQRAGRPLLPDDVERATIGILRAELALKNDSIVTLEAEVDQLTQENAALAEALRRSPGIEPIRQP